MVEKLKNCVDRLKSPLDKNDVKLIIKSIPAAIPYIGSVYSAATTQSEIEQLNRNLESVISELKKDRDDNSKYINKLIELVNRYKDPEFLNWSSDLYKEGFKIITSDYFSKYRPNKNCWDEGFRLIDVWHNYDARREITDTVEKGLEERDVLVLGESGFGKTILLYRVIVDFVKKGYQVLYKENGTNLEHPERVAEIIMKYFSDKNVLIAIDNIHLKDRNIKAFYIVENVERFKNRDKIKFFFTAKKPEFDDLLKRDKDIGMKEHELKRKANEFKKEKGCELKELTLKETELFMMKYFDLAGGKWILDKTILCENIKKALQSYYGESKGDPLLLTSYLTRDERGLRDDVIYKLDNYIHGEMEEDFVFLTCFLESMNVVVKPEYLKRVLKLDKETYNSIIRELLTRVIYTTENKDLFWTRHPRWALEYLKFVFEREKEESFEEKLIEKVEDFTDALFDLHDENLAYNLVSGLSRLIVYNEDLRELFLSSLKVLPEFLSAAKKAELLTSYVGGVYYRIHEYNEAINTYTKAIKLNPKLVEAYLFRGGIYSDKGEFDRAIEDFNKGIKLKPSLALAYNGRGTVYLKKKEFDKAIEDFNKEIELGSIFEAGAYLNRGTAYIDKGEFDKAIKDFNGAIDLYPGYAKAYSSRGSAYAEKDESDRAIEDYNKAIVLNPKLAEAYNNRGLAYKKKGDLDKAVQGYDAAIELEPDFGVAYSNRGVAYGEKAEFDKAIEDHNKAIELNPKDAKAYINRGNAYADKGEFNEAIENYNKAIELNPKLAEAYNNRGLTYKNKGEFDKAIVDCNKATELDPSFADAYSNRGLVYAEKVEYDKAIKDYNKAIELNPKLADAYNNRGLAYAGKGEFDRAIEDFDEAIELNPKLADAYNNRGVAYKEKGEFDRAIENYNKALELNPGYYGAYSNRGVAYAAKGEFEEAIENYNKAIELNPKLADAHNNRGNAYAGKREFDRAIEDYNKALELNPGYYGAYLNCGIAYSSRGEFDKAIENYNKAIELDPKLADAYNSRGNTYWKKGEFDRAIEDYNKAIELNPNLAEVYSNRANAYFEKGEHDKAIQDFSKVIELKPDNARAYSDRGNAYACKNELDEAIEDYNKAIELKPDHVEALYSIRGIMYGIKGDIGRAVEDYNKAKELTGVDVYGSKEMFKKAIQYIRNVGFEYFIKTQRAFFTELITDVEAMEHYKIGNSYLINQEFDKAIENFDKVIKRKPNFGMTYFIRGQIYLKKREFDKAIDDYNEAIELNPNDATAYHDRGLAYKEKGEYDKAVEDFNKTIGLNPKIAWAGYQNIGLVYVNKEEFDKAIEYFTKAIETKSDYAEAYYNRGECYRQRNDFINCANDFINCANDFANSAFLFFLQKRGNEALKLFKATYDLRGIIDSPVCFECGAVLVAFAEVIGSDPKYAEEHAKRIRDIQKHREEISKSARVVLDYLISEEVQEEIEVKDVRDAVFKLLLDELKV